MATWCMLTRRMLRTVSPLNVTMGSRRGAQHNTSGISGGVVTGRIINDQNAENNFRMRCLPSDMKRRDRKHTSAAFSHSMTEKEITILSNLGYVSSCSLFRIRRVSEGAPCSGTHDYDFLHNEIVEAWIQPSLGEVHWDLSRDGHQRLSRNCTHCLLAVGP